MDVGEIAWRVFGPVWATLMTLVMLFPITLVAALGARHALANAPTEMRHDRAAFYPLLLVVPLWIWSAAFRSDQLGPPAVVRTAGVLTLLAVHVVAIIVAWRRLRWRGAGLGLLLPQLWVTLVASFIGLWWVEGWASL